MSNARIIILLDDLNCPGVSNLNVCWEGKHQGWQGWSLIHLNALRFQLLYQPVPQRGCVAGKDRIRVGSHDMPIATHEFEIELTGRPTGIPDVKTQLVIGFLRRKNLVEYSSIRAYIDIIDNMCHPLRRRLASYQHKYLWQSNRSSVVQCMCCCLLVFDIGYRFGQADIA